MLYLQWFRKLVPGCKAADPAVDGKDHEGQPGTVCPTRKNPQGTSAVQLRADWALPLVSELRWTVLQSNHLVRRRHQRIPCHNSQGQIQFWSVDHETPNLLHWLHCLWAIFKAFCPCCCVRLCHFVAGIAYIFVCLFLTRFVILFWLGCLIFIVNL